MTKRKFVERLKVIYNSKIHIQSCHLNNYNCYVNFKSVTIIFPGNDNQKTLITESIEIFIKNR